MLTLEEQKKAKPEYQIVVNLFLKDETKKNLDDLVKHIADLKLKPHWYAFNAFSVKYKSKTIFRFTINGDNTFTIFFSIVDKKEDINIVVSKLPKDMQDFYFENFRRCTNNTRFCKPEHKDKNKIVILGKEYKYCAAPEFVIHNPTKEQLRYIERFVLMRKENIASLN